MAIYTTQEKINELNQDELMELLENAGGYSELMDMEEMDMLGFEPLDYILRSYHGSAYDSENGNFNPYAQYFYLDAYGNFISVQSHEVSWYLEDKIRDVAYICNNIDDLLSELEEDEKDQAIEELEANGYYYQ